MDGIGSGRRRFLLTAGAAAALLATRAGHAERTGAKTHAVTIDAFEFKPPLLTVRRGDTIVWHNTDPVPHTVTAKGAFDSGSIAAGATWKHVVAAKGKFDYICTFHPNMKGTLVVE